MGCFELRCTVGFALSDHVVVALEEVADFAFASIRVSLTCWSSSANLELVLLAVANLRSLVHVDHLIEGRLLVEALHF